MRIAVTVALLTWMAVLTGYDLRQRRLPNLLTLPGAAVILSSAALAGRGVPALAGATALTTLYLLVHLICPTGMGAGDVKLAIGLGALTGCFGVATWFLAAIIAPLLTALAALVSGKRVLPHGPAMALAAAGAVGLATLPGSNGA